MSTAAYKPPRRDPAGATLEAEAALEAECRRLEGERQRATKEAERLKAALEGAYRRSTMARALWALFWLAIAAGVFLGLRWTLTETMAWGETARANAEREARRHLGATQGEPPQRVDCVQTQCTRPRCTGHFTAGRVVVTFCDDDPPRFNDGCRDHLPEVGCDL